MIDLKLGEIDLSLAPIQKELYLCRPDKTVISSLKDINGLKYNMKLSVVDELSFTIPTQVERNHKLIDNPLIEKIKHRYLFKLIHNHKTTYFLFNERDKEYGSDESVSYHAFGLGYELVDKDVRSYEAVSKSLTEMLYDVLNTSNWTIGYVDAYFDTKLRSHNIDDSTILQAVYDLAEKFNAVIIWDTNQLKVSMYNPSNIGSNKGFKLKEGKYLESFSLNDNSEDVVTRLRVFGQDGLTIRNLSPTGMDYLEDFSWYVHPFERDEAGNVIQQSDHMSNSLAIALEDYKAHLSTLRGEFDRLLILLLAKQDEIFAQNQIYSVLVTELIQIHDELDVYNATQNGNHADILSRKTAKETEVNTCEDLILSLIDQETAIQNDIDTLRVQTAIETHLTPAQILELNKFVVIKSYTNDTIVDEEDLLEDGIEAFRKFRVPQVSLNMSLYNFLSNIEHQNDHNKLGLGDIVAVTNSRLQVDVQAKITEIEFDFDGDSISLQIADERVATDSDEWFEEQLNAAANAGNTVDMNKFKWGLIEDTNSMVNQILNSEWDAAKNSIVAGYKQNITISERGIIIKSPENPMDVLVIQNGMLAISNDGMNTWKHAVTANGCIQDKLLSKNLTVKGGLHFVDN